MVKQGIALTFLLGAIVLGSPAAAAACPNDVIAPAALDEVAAREAVLCLLNERRSSQGIGPLSEDPRLDGAAQGHSASMNAHNFFAHGNFQRRIARSGYMSGSSTWTIAENLYWGSAFRGSPARAVAAWMASRRHRDAILSGRYRDVGIGVALGSPVRRKGGNSAIYTVDFGSRG